jgi:hypothetical protein
MLMIINLSSSQRYWLTCLWPSDIRTTNVCSRFGPLLTWPISLTLRETLLSCSHWLSEPAPANAYYDKEVHLSPSRVCPTQLVGSWKSCPLLGDQGESAEPKAFYRDNIATCRNPSIRMGDAASRMGSPVVTGISGCNHPLLVRRIFILKKSS